jgi:hypothetical protein
MIGLVRFPAQGIKRIQDLVETSAEANRHGNQDTSGVSPSTEEISVETCGLTMPQSPVKTGSM